MAASPQDFPSSQSPRPSTHIHTIPKEVCRTLPWGCHFLTPLLHMDLLLALALTPVSRGVLTGSNPQARVADTLPLTLEGGGYGGQSWVPIWPQHRHELSVITLKDLGFSKSPNSLLPTETCPKATKLKPEKAKRQETKSSYSRLPAAIGHRVQDT